MLPRVIVAMHVASGALAGAGAGSRARAALAGLALHALGDAIPHRDFPSRPFELGSGVALLGLLALRRGPASPELVGAAVSAAPDLEHLLPLPRPGGRGLFPSHRFTSWHRAGGVSAPAQLVAAVVIVGVLVLRNKEP
jgi:hypothetical protein